MLAFVAVIVIGSTCKYSLVEQKKKTYLRLKTRLCLKPVYIASHIGDDGGGVIVVIAAAVVVEVKGVVVVVVSECVEVELR